MPDRAPVLSSDGSEECAMDPARFDRFAKTLGRARSRRTVLATLGATALAAIGWRNGGVSAAPGTPAATATPVLAANNSTSFVQTASGGTFRPNPKVGTATPGAGTPASVRPGAYLLTLTGHSRLRRPAVARLCRGSDPALLHRPGLPP